MKRSNYILLSIFAVLLLLNTACNRGASKAQTATKQQKKENLERPNLEEQTVKAEEAKDGPTPEGSHVAMRNYYSNTPDTVITMRKTACFGSCPVYKITILANGNMSYLGKRNVENIGTYSTSVSLKTIRNIDQMLHDMSILKMSEHYPEDGEDIVDLPNTIVETTFRGKKKHIFINHDAPDSLKNLIEYIEQLMAKASWSAVNTKN